MPSTVALISPWAAVSSGTPSLSMVRTCSVLAWAGSSTTSFTAQWGGGPWRALSGVRLVNQMSPRSVRKPLSEANAIRNPSRAPRLVDSTRKIDPQKRPTAKTTMK